MGFALQLLGAHFQSLAYGVVHLNGLDAALAGAAWIITGEGRFDESSLSGKGPGAVAARALALGKPAQVFAGSATTVARAGLGLHAITPDGTPLAQALRDAAANLSAAVRRSL